MMKPVSAATAATAPKPIDPSLRKAAQGFEAVFLREMIGTMRKAKLADDMFGSSATDNFRELADANLAENMSKMGQFGIASMLEKQFAQMGSKS